MALYELSDQEVKVALEFFNIALKSVGDQAANPYLILKGKLSKSVPVSSKTENMSKPSKMENSPIPVQDAKKKETK